MYSTKTAINETCSNHSLALTPSTAIQNASWSSVSCELRLLSANFWVFPYLGIIWKSTSL